MMRKTVDRIELKISAGTKSRFVAIAVGEDHAVKNSALKSITEDS